MYKEHPIKICWFFSSTTLNKQLFVQLFSLLFEVIDFISFKFQGLDKDLSWFLRPRYKNCKKYKYFVGLVF